MTKELENIVSVNNFKMAFNGKIVIKDMSFAVKRGEIFGLLGSNGSGKTTTIRTLLGLYQPTGGELLINGEKYDPTKVKVGYLPEERGLYKKETVIDTMVYFGELKGLKNPKAWSLKFLKRVGIFDKADERIEKLSTGQQQKVQLGITIMNQPELLILDEPTKGFDPINRRLLMNIIDEQKAKGSTVILITHDMAEVERLCDRLLLLKNGNKHAYGTVSEVLKKFNKKNMDDVFLEVYGAHAREEILDNGQAS